MILPHYRLPVLFFTLLLLGFFFITSCPAAEITVAPQGADYTEIQPAIDWAIPGDLVTVKSGLFKGGIRINKTITLIGIDTGRGIPVIDSQFAGTGIEIAADSCTVNGFLIQNAIHESGIRISSHGNRILNNTLSANAEGLSLLSANGNTISGNVISDSSRAGISLINSPDNLFEDNRISDNSVGIVVDASSNRNRFYHNTFSNTEEVSSKSTTTEWESAGLLRYTYLGSNVESRMGNYWRGYRGKDTNGDGVGDTPYIIQSAGSANGLAASLEEMLDLFPLMDPKEYYHNITTATGMVGTTPITPGATRTIAVTSTPQAPATQIPVSSDPVPILPAVFALVLMVGAGGLFYMYQRRKGSPPPSGEPQPPVPVSNPDTIVESPEQNEDRTAVDDATIVDSGDEEQPGIAHKFYFPKELEGKYSGISYIGRGGVAHVFAARRKSDDKLVAVKIPISFDEITGRCFLNEISAWEKLRHPNIVEVLALNILPVPYVEMEYVPGSLETVMKPLPVWKAVHIIRGVADALEYAHARGIIHRDIKPHNILVTEDLVPKITDWGMSKLMATGMDKSSVAGFSLSYAAPEQVSPADFGRTDTRTDIYQLGVVFYELVTGSIPFGGESVVEVGSAIVREKPIPPSEYNPDAAIVERIILTCLEKDPADRFQSAAELVDSLAGYLDEDEE